MTSSKNRRGTVKYNEFVGLMRKKNNLKKMQGGQQIASHHHVGFAMSSKVVGSESHRGG